MRVPDVYQLLLPLLVVTVGLAGCGGAETPAPVVAERVENAELGVAIAALPARFSVLENRGTTLRLAEADGDPGEVDIAVGPERPGGINLVDVVKERRAVFEAGGLYYGNRELMTPYGSAYTARGQLAGADGPIEETWVFALHPSGTDRMLSVVYRYPGGGDSQERVQALLELLGEIEAL